MLDPGSCRSFPALLFAALCVAAPASAVTIDWVPVGHPGNAPDTLGNCYAESCGSVAYAYAISKYEVTNAQYAEFLNAKAASDPLGLYNTSMGSSTEGGITRGGSSGSYSYAVKAGMANKPVTFVSFYDALRFANWLHNGQGNGDTETGAYLLLGGTPVPSNWETVARSPGAKVFLPSENEWYKAAYYDGALGAYYAYPAGSDAQSTCAMPTATANRANCGGAVGTVTDVGAYPGSASPYGTFDQGGNVWEWNEQIAFGSAFSRGFRGGSWFYLPGNLAASSRNGFTVTNEESDVGFRVAPEPATSLPAVLALLALATRRGRLTGTC